MTPGTRVIISNDGSLNGLRGTIVSHKPPLYYVLLDSFHGVPGIELAIHHSELLRLNAQGNVEDDEESNGL